MKRCYSNRKEIQLQYESNENSIVSFYQLVFDIRESHIMNINRDINTYVVDMIKTLQDFSNRFPTGAIAPERTVNLPARDKKSRVLSQRKLHYFI